MIADAPANVLPVGVFEVGEHVVLDLDLYLVVAAHCDATVLRRLRDGEDVVVPGNTRVGAVFVSPGS